MMGLPDEYLLDWQAQAVRHGLSKTTSFQDYLTYLLLHHSTPNGVFAIKGSVDEMQPFFDYFPNAPTVWLVRENKIEQAVSWHRAHDGGVWTRTSDSAIESQLEFSVDRVRYFHQEILRREAMWKTFFDNRDASPLCLTYERVCEDPVNAVKAIAAHIGIETNRINEPSSPLRVVRDEQSSKWAAIASEAISSCESYHAQQQ